MYKIANIDEQRITITWTLYKRILSFWNTDDVHLTNPIQTITQSSD